MIFHTELSLLLATKRRVRQCAVFCRFEEDLDQKLSSALTSGLLHSAITVLILLSFVIIHFRLTRCSRGVCAG